jgi:hypothetical protein
MVENFDSEEMSCVSESRCGYLVFVCRTEYVTRWMATNVVDALPTRRRAAPVCMPIEVQGGLGGRGSASRSWTRT